MVLEPVVCRLIDSGKKTMLRRPVVGGEQRYRPRAKGVRDGGQSRQLVRPPVPKVGDRWPIKPGAEKPVMCRVKVVLVRTEIHGAISFEDVRREGYRTTVEYKAGWVRWHDRQWIAQVGDELDPTSNEQLVPRFDARWAERQVYVVQFEVDRSAGRYLAANPGAQLTDYVGSPLRAMSGEPQAVDEETQRIYAEQGRKDKQLRVTVEWAAARAEIEAKIAALEQHDLSVEQVKHLRVLRHQIDVGDRKFAA